MIETKYDLTVFIISCEEESFDECISSIKNQTLNQSLNIKIDVIQNVFPMSEAFNEMHRRCKTKFFVQVDADMTLNHDALEILYNGINGTSIFTYASYGQLFEEGFGIGGAVRCWRTSVLKMFPFRDRRTVDRDLYKRLRWLGFKRKDLKQVIGKHHPRHNEFTNYLKTKSDVEKWRFLGRDPSMYALPLLEELSVKPNEEKLRIFGLLTGALTPKARNNSSKDLKVETERLNTLLKSLETKSIEEIEISDNYSLTNNLRNHFSNAYNFKSQDELIGELVNFFPTLNKISKSKVKEIFSL